MISVAAISDQLRDRCEELVRELLPAAKRDGPYLKVGSVMGEAGSSLVIHLNGQRRGKWTDYAGGDGAHGDMLDLIGAVHGFHAAADRVAWAKQWLGIHDDWSPRDAVRPNPEELARRAEDARARAEAAQAEEAKERAAKMKGARALYLHRLARPIAGTPVEAYLRGRGLSHDPLPAWPNALRFHPEVWNREHGEKMPAMLAPMYLADGTHVATHRTWLRPCPTRGWAKIDGKNAKKVLGPSWGAFIPINKGVSGKAMSAMPEGEAIYMAEGVEDCIAIRMKRPEARIIAGYSLGNMGAVVLPPHVRTLVIVADRDDKSAEVDKLERSIAQQQARGVTVKLVMPPVGVKDLNDWLNALSPASPGGRFSPALPGSLSRPQADAAGALASIVSGGGGRCDVRRA